MATMTASDGAVLHFEREGAGPPVILIHGFASSPRVFDRQVSALAKHHTVIRPHLRGHGQSAGIGHGGRMSRLARDLHDLIEQEGLDAICLVGWSMGASVVWSYLDAFGSQRVAGYVIVDELPYVIEAIETLGRPVERIEPGPVFGLHGKFADPQTRVDAVEGFINSMLRTASNVDREVIRADARLGATPLAVRLLLDSNSTDFRDLIGELRVPVLFISGAESFFKPEFFRWMHAAAPDSRLAILPGTGHFVPVEAAEALTAELLAFLAELGGRSGRDVEGCAA